MKRVIKYEYRYWDLGCQCCHDSSSSYCMWGGGVLVDEDVWCEYASNATGLLKQGERLCKNVPKSS